MESKKTKQIMYACYHQGVKEGEQFVPHHTFSYQIAGTLTMYDGQKQYTFTEGSFRLARRNTLIKFNKQPPANGDYKNLSVYIDQESLREFSLEYGYTSARQYTGAPVIDLKASPLFKSYVASMEPYEQLSELYTDDLKALKIKEAILLLLQTNPQLKDLLFDFADPGKIDLEAFMNQNYHFNVDLTRFAYLTGRSLATFRRDFEKIFHNSPSRWLIQRRLQEAHYQIKELGKAPSDIYFDLGFEDLSHFSFAFKKMYGVAPSRV